MGAREQLPSSADCSLRPAEPESALQLWLSPPSESSHNCMPASGPEHDHFETSTVRMYRVSLVLPGSLVMVVEELTEQDFNVNF